MAVKYQEAGKKLHLVHLSPDCVLLLKQAKDMVEVNLIEDPNYGILVDYASVMDKKERMADRAGFEPAQGMNPNTLSKRAP